MGQIADDMVEGFSCSWCGVYFEEEHGYPVACSSCFESEKREHPEKFKKTKLAGYIHDSGIQKAIFAEL